MKTLCLILLALFLYPGTVLPATSAPREIGGFRLGASIDEYDFISYRNFLKEVVVQDIDGFRKGVISYGTCARPGEIVKIKLKYLDTSESFFKELLKRYKKKFGRPDQYIGDSFGIVKAWQWEFTDKQGELIRLKLQHNLKNPDEAMGNTVKLEMPNRIREERKCFNRQCEARMRMGNCPMPTPEGKNWSNLIPR